MTTLSNRVFSAGAISACALLVLMAGNANAQSATPSAAAAAPAQSSTIGTVVDDSMITTKVRAALMSNEEVKSLDIKVKTYKGEVMLSGFVDNQSQIDRAVAVAKGIEGVANVDNQLSVKAGKQTVGNKIDDSVITGRVKAALLSDPAVKSLDVLVVTRKGEVQLSGFVDDASQMTRAQDVAKGIDGVTGVVNHMTVKK